MNFQSCVLCNQSEFHQIASRGRDNHATNIVICRNCSLVQVNPRESHEKAVRFYEEKYHRHSTGMDRPSDQFIIKSRAFAEQRIQVLESLVEIGEMSLLDVGCSCGEFLRQIRTKVKSAQGVEPGRDFTDYGMRNFDLDIFVGDLSAFSRVSQAKYNIVTLFTVLEHLISPTELLSDINSFLVDEGLLFLEVPNFLAFLKAIRNKKKFHQYFSPYHLQYFSENSLRRMLNSAGFQLIYLNAGRSKYLRVLGKKCASSGFRAGKKGKDNIFFINFLSALWKVKSNLT